MKKEPYNVIHDDSVTTDIACLDNIARAILDLNETMIDIKQALQLIALKIGEQKNG